MSKEQMTSSIMAHEAAHAAGQVCDYVGIKAEWGKRRGFCIFNIIYSQMLRKSKRLSRIKARVA